MQIGNKTVPMMDVRLASVLLSVPDRSGLAAVISDQLTLITKLRMTPAAFAMFDQTAFGIAAGSLGLGPAFVMVVLLRASSGEPAPLLVHLALNPADAEHLAAIRCFVGVAQIPLRAFDPTLYPLGIKAIPVDERTRFSVDSAVAAAEQVAADLPDPQEVAKLPYGVTPFQAAATALANEIVSHLPI